MSYKRRWIAVCIAGGLVGIYAVCYFSSSLGPYLHQEKRINTLLIGCDELKYSRHADTIILLSYEPRNRFLDVFSIPRDTWVKPRGRRAGRLSDIYARVYQTSKDEFKSARALTGAVSQLLNVRIPFFFQIKYQGFKNIVNLIRGVEIHPDQEMHYDDYAGNLHIHIESKRQVFSGHEALNYVRFRGGVLADRSRVIRQQKFLQAAINKLLKPVYFLGSLQFFKIKNILKKCIVTNLNFYDILAILPEVKSLCKTNIRFQQLPGSVQSIRKISCWYPNKIVLQQVIDLITASNTIKPGEGVPTITQNFEIEKIVAEVWNATSINDLALGLTRKLRSKGIDVVRWGNYGEHRLHTVVIDRGGNFRKAQKIARLFNNCEVTTDVDKQRLVDVSIVIGDDALIKF